MTELTKEIYCKYTKRRQCWHKDFDKLPQTEKDFFCTYKTYSAMVGDLGEIIARENLVSNNYSVYSAEMSFFFVETYNNIILPKYFLDKPEIKKYQKIDRYINQRYQVSGICKCLSSQKKFRKLNKKEIRSIVEAKRLKVGRKEDYWNGHPGRLDFVTEKEGKIEFFEIKTNTSQSNDWQKFRILSLKQNKIPAQIIRVRLNFNLINTQKENINIAVRVPFKKKYAFGILTKKCNLSKDNYFVQIPEYVKQTTLQFRSNKIEKISYSLEFEDIQTSKIEMPTNIYIKEIKHLYELYYGKHPNCGKGQTYI